MLMISDYYLILFAAIFGQLQKLKSREKFKCTNS